VLLEDILGKNIVPSKFVFAVKHEDGWEAYKSRFCLGGHRDFLKHHMVHTSSTLTMISVCLILSIAAIFGWNVWTTDVQQAYLQSASLLKNEVFLKTNALELGPNELVQIYLPLYGLSESGDYWGETLTNHLLHQLRFAQSGIDSSLCFKIFGSRLAGLSGCYVDELLRAAPLEFQELLENTIREVFDCKPSAEVMVDHKATLFIGLDMERELDTFVASMSTYIVRLQHLSPKTCFEEYRSLRAKMLWTCNARPDICAFVSVCSSVTAATFSTKDVRDINNQVSYL
jgi:Reverse transcriptase (RNA-dependent DNA polymerase)